jgi:hypothetical protein
MSRITLAFRCFFRLIFKGQLPRDAVGFLPKEALQLEAAKPEGAKPEVKKEPVKQAPEPVEPKKEPPRKEKPELMRTSGETPTAKLEERRLEQELKQEQKKKADNVALQREGALAFLALLQREGRLIDFLRESLDGFADADIGAAARDVHRGCRKVLEEHLRLEAMMPGEEEDTVTVPKGFDPGEIRLIGEVKGEPPFKGVMRHHGWRAIEVKLPTLGDGVDRHVLAPAEIEIA